MDLNFIRLNNFKCKRCGYDKYDKLMYTGDKLLDDPDVKILDRYVCRNCDYVINLSDYVSDDIMSINSSDLINNATIINENEGDK